ncbi:MAG: ABC transporter ATP-binding protein [Lachnospiraceae bacterium]|nr:ABC transporter ATP-binding protein [Lachnospiraceae bacterium]
MAELICRNIKKRYKDKEVLHGIDLTLEEGKIYGLIGRNGVGKTTLLSILAAHNPATEGEITLNGEQVWENQNALDHICFSRELNPLSNNGMSGTVKEYLMAASVYFPHWDKDYADRLVKEFDLDIKKKLIKVSKGMLSMVTIIIALASKAKFTMMDEPVAGLDVFMREKFYQLLLEEYTQTGRTFVVSTHIIDEASSVLEEVIVMKEGNIILKENTEELLGRCVHVSGKIEDVDRATEGLTARHTEIVGRSKGVTVFLKEGEQVNTSYDVSVQPVTLQKVFVALCGEENDG